MQEKQLTDLDRKLQEIALMNWNQFVSIIGRSAILKAKVCLLRQENKSYGEISQKLGIAEHQARYSCVKCEPEELHPTKKG